MFNNLLFGENAKFTANTGIGIVTTANTKLDGTGAMGTVLTATDPSGTFIETVTVKTQANITQGMVRLFVYDGVSVTRLLLEVEIPIAGRSGIFPSFTRTINLNYFLKAGYVLKASTEGTFTTNVIAIGYDVSFP